MPEKVHVHPHGQLHVALPRAADAGAAPAPRRRHARLCVVVRPTPSAPCGWVMTPAANCFSSTRSLCFNRHASVCPLGAGRVNSSLTRPPTLIRLIGTIQSLVYPNSSTAHIMRRRAGLLRSGGRCDET